MNISALNSAGESVNIVSIVPNGCQIYVSYLDSSNNLKVDRLFLSGNNDIIATSASIVA
jgi:hypothetical protein